MEVSSIKLMILGLMFVLFGLTSSLRGIEVILLVAGIIFVITGFFMKEK